eukprot:12831807-Ditylum_brightwellii.AAC.1
MPAVLVCQLLNTIALLSSDVANVRLAKALPVSWWILAAFTTTFAWYCVLCVAWLILLWSQAALMKWSFNADHVFWAS